MSFVIRSSLTGTARLPRIPEECHLLRQEQIQRARVWSGAQPLENSSSLIPRSGRSASSPWETHSSRSAGGLGIPVQGLRSASHPGYQMAFLRKTPRYGQAGSSSIAGWPKKAIPSQIALGKNLLVSKIEWKRRASVRLNKSRYNFHTQSSVLSPQFFEF